MTKQSVSKTKLAILISTIAAFIGVMLVATFLDLRISLAISNSNSLIGQFIEYLGEFPAYLAPAVGLLIIFQGITKDNKFYLALKILFGILTFVGFTVFVYYFMKKMVFEELMYRNFYLIVFSIVVTSLAMLGTYKVDKQLMKKLTKFAIFIIAIMALSQIIVTICKGLWSRLRLRNMNSNYDGFTRWYQLGEKGRDALIVPDSYHSNSDAFNSFPSGHTAAAAVTFGLIMLPDLFSKLKKYKIWFYIGPAAYTLLVAIARIVVKAHFLSDVTIAATITITSAFFLRWLIFKIDTTIKSKQQIKE